MNTLLRFTSLTSSGGALLTTAAVRESIFISRNDILILRQKFLEPLWEEFHSDWSYWKSVGINIGGFIPLGFFVCAYLTIVRQLTRPALVTIILGAAVSVTIEVLQAYLPTRDSGMTDILTNTLGTGLGVALYRWPATFLNKALNSLVS
jgi:glycopeptide antibiotics resistance protein